MSHSPRTNSVSIAVLLGLASTAHAQRVLFDVHGAVAGGYAAHAVVLDDWNGDGFAEVAIGAPRDGTNGFTAGAVRVHSGADGTVFATFLGKSDGDHFGEHVARLPDVNANGTDELLVNAPATGDVTGSLYLYDGGSGTELWHVDSMGATIRTGTQIGPAGDVNGDGVGDLYVGGEMRIRSGVDGSDLLPKYAQFPFGHSIDAIGDLDGDGIRELLIGDRWFKNSTGQYLGAAYIVSPGNPYGPWLRTHVGTFVNQLLGYDVAALGDLDGDGVRDYAVASRVDSAGFAAMFDVYSGQSGVRLAQIVSPDSSTPLAPRVVDAGDVNGDGVRDLALAGAWTDAQGTPHAAAFLVSGATFLFFDRVETDDLETLPAAAGDFDGDGRDDLIVGSLGAGYDGRVHVMAGAPLWLNATPSQPVAGATLDLATREGVAGKPTVLVVEAVDGSPTFVILAGLATFGPLGGRKIVAPVPPGLAGHVATLRAYAHDAVNRPIWSEPQDVEFK